MKCMAHKVINFDLKATTPQVMETMLDSLEEDGWFIITIVQASDGVIWTVLSNKVQLPQQKSFGGIE